MHAKVYTHRKAKGIEFMVADALKEAEPVLKLADKLWEVPAYLELDDGILRRLQFMDPDETHNPAGIRRVSWERAKGILACVGC